MNHNGTSSQGLLTGVFVENGDQDSSPTLAEPWRQPWPNPKVHAISRPMYTQFSHRRSAVDKVLGARQDVGPDVIGMSLTKYFAWAFGQLTSATACQDVDVPWRVEANKSWPQDTSGRRQALIVSAAAGPSLYDSLTLRRTQRP